MGRLRLMAPLVPLRPGTAPVPLVPPVITVQAVSLTLASTAVWLTGPAGLKGPAATRELMLQGAVCREQRGRGEEAGGERRRRRGVPLCIPGPSARRSGCSWVQMS